MKFGFTRRCLPVFEDHRRRGRLWDVIGGQMRHRDRRSYPAVKGKASGPHSRHVTYSNIPESANTVTKPLNQPISHARPFIASETKKDPAIAPTSKATIAVPLLKTTIPNQNAIGSGTQNKQNPPSTRSLNVRFAKAAADFSFGPRKP
jgi:hypothetical protein